MEQAKKTGSSLQNRPKRDINPAFSDKKVIRKTPFRLLHPDSNLEIAKFFTPDRAHLPDSSVKTAGKYEENS